MSTPEGYQWYFAYGSNNSYEQLLRRLGNVSPTAKIDNSSSGGMHNTIFDTNIYPPLAIKVVLLPYYYFIIDAPSAIAGLGYANLRRTTVDENDGTPLTLHAQDEVKNRSEVMARPPYVVSVAYLLSEQQLLMMDKFENAPDKYRRQPVRGVCLKDINPLPHFEKQIMPDCIAGSPVTTDSTGAVVCVPREPSQRTDLLNKVNMMARKLENDLALLWANAEKTSSDENSERRFRERFFERTISELLLEVCDNTSTDLSIQGLLDNNTSSPYVIDGIAYIYEGTGLLHTDVSPNGADPTNKENNGTSSFPFAVDINSAVKNGSSIIQPSSSYMGRILEGDYFFGLLDDENNNNARRITTANCLLAAYVSYLHKVEPSPIPSPRTFLRAAGKV